MLAWKGQQEMVKPGIIGQGLLSCDTGVKNIVLLETLEMCKSFGAEENLLCFGEVGELEKQFLELFFTAAVLFATLEISSLIVCTTSIRSCS